MSARLEWLPGDDDAPTSSPQPAGRASDDPAIIDGRYRIAQPIGAGAMGVVYRAEDVWLGRMVALKVIEPSQSRDPDTVERFKREARALAQVRHDNVVQVYAFGPHAGSFYLAMEHVRGRSLESIIEEQAARGAVLPHDRALALIRRVAYGLGAVHACSLIHRDVKPSNILVEQGTGRPVLVDFGLARSRDVLDAKLSKSGGTPCYMPPEQLSAGGARIGPAADVYALACTAFELLTGTVVFSGQTTFDVLRAHNSEPPPLVSSRRPELVALDPVFVRALAKSPDDRHPTCAAFAADLDAGARKLGSIFPRPAGTVSRRRARVLVLEDDDSLRRQLVRTTDRVFREIGQPTEIECVRDPDRFREAFDASGAEMLILDDDSCAQDAASLLRAIRATSTGAGVPALILSRRWKRASKGLDRDTRELPKPLSTQALLAVVRELGAEIGKRRRAAGEST